MESPDAFAPHHYVLFEHYINHWRAKYSNMTKCFICNLEFNDKSNKSIRAHLDYCSKGQFELQHCNACKSFWNRFLNAPMICIFCFSQFRTLDDFMEHIRSYIDIPRNFWTLQIRSTQMHSIPSIPTIDTMEDLEFSELIEFQRTKRRNSHFGKILNCLLCLTRVESFEAHLLGHIDFYYSPEKVQIVTKTELESFVRHCRFCHFDLLYANYQFNTNGEDGHNSRVRLLLEKNGNDPPYSDCSYCFSFRARVKFCVFSLRMIQMKRRQVRDANYFMCVARPRCQRWFLSINHQMLHLLYNCTAVLADFNPPRIVEFHLRLQDPHFILNAFVRHYLKLKRNNDANCDVCEFLRAKFKEFCLRRCIFCLAEVKDVLRHVLSVHLHVNKDSHQGSYSYREEILLEEHISNESKKSPLEKAKSKILDSVPPFHAHCRQKLLQNAQAVNLNRISTFAFYAHIQTKHLPPDFTPDCQICLHHHQNLKRSSSSLNCCPYSLHAKLDSLHHLATHVEASPPINLNDSQRAAAHFYQHFLARHAQEGEDPDRCAYCAFFLAGRFLTILASVLRFKVVSEGQVEPVFGCVFQFECLRLAATPGEILAHLLDHHENDLLGIAALRHRDELQRALNYLEHKQQGLQECTTSTCEECREYLREVIKDGLTECVFCLKRYHADSILAHLRFVHAYEAEWESEEVTFTLPFLLETAGQNENVEEIVCYVD